MTLPPGDFPPCAHPGCPDPEGGIFATANFDWRPPGTPGRGVQHFQAVWRILVPFVRCWSHLYVPKEG